MTNVTLEIADVHGATLGRALVRRIPAARDDGDGGDRVKEKLVPVVAGAKLAGALIVRARLANGEVFTSYTGGFPSFRLY